MMIFTQQKFFSNIFKFRFTECYVVNAYVRTYDANTEHEPLLKSKTLSTIYIHVAL